MSALSPIANIDDVGRDVRFVPKATALQGWIVIGLLVLITLGIVGIGVELEALPYLWRTSAEGIR